MNERQRRMLQALARRPCATLGPSDLIDEDYLALVHGFFVREYWGTGGAMCIVTDKGRAAIEPAHDKEEV